MSYYFVRVSKITTTWLWSITWHWPLHDSDPLHEADHTWHNVHGSDNYVTLITWQSPLLNNNDYMNMTTWQWPLHNSDHYLAIPTTWRGHKWAAGQVVISLKQLFVNSVLILRGQGQAPVIVRHDHKPWYTLVLLVTDEGSDSGQFTHWRHSRDRSWISVAKVRSCARAHTHTHRRIVIHTGSKKYIDRQHMLTCMSTQRSWNTRVVYSLLLPSSVLPNLRF